MLFNKRGLLACAISSLLILTGTGCQTSISALSTNNSEIRTNVLDIIADESQKALLAQQSLKNSQEQTLKTLRIKQSRIDHDVLIVDFIGMPELLLASTAQNFGYRYLENGRKKALPVVNFTSRKLTGTELVKDIAVMIDGNADITLDHQNKTILLTYR